MTKREVKRYMIDNISDHIDPLTGEANATTLAEDAANHFNAWEWLDDEAHFVWDVAVDVCKLLEQGKICSGLV